MVSIDLKYIYLYIRNYNISLHFWKENFLILFVGEEIYSKIRGKIYSVGGFGKVDFLFSAMFLMVSNM